MVGDVERLDEFKKPFLVVSVLLMLSQRSRHKFTDLLVKCGLLMIGVAKVDNLIPPYFRTDHIIHPVAVFKLPVFDPAQACPGFFYSESQYDKVGAVEFAGNLLLDLPADLITVVG